MNNIFTKAVLYVVLVLSVSSINANTANIVKVLVKNITDKEGVIYLLVCNKQQFDMNSFNSKSCFVSKKQDVTGASEYALTINDLPLGDWAIYGFIDANNNGKIDTNSVGVPEETVIFASILKNAPKFNDIKVSITSNNQTVTLLAQ